jgi:hypothetical protein
VGKCGGNSFSVLGYAEHVDMPLCGNRAKLFPPHPFKKFLKHSKESANKVGAVFYKSRMAGDSPPRFAS